MIRGHTVIATQRAPTLASLTAKHFGVGLAFGALDGITLVYAFRRGKRRVDPSHVDWFHLSQAQHISVGVRGGWS